MGRRAGASSRGWARARRVIHFADDAFPGRLAKKGAAHAAADGRGRPADDRRRRPWRHPDGKGGACRRRRGVAALAAAAGGRPVRAGKQWRRRLCRRPHPGRARLAGAAGAARRGCGVARRRGRRGGALDGAGRAAVAGGARRGRARDRRDLWRRAGAAGRRGGAGGHRGARSARGPGGRGRCPERRRRRDRRGRRCGAAGDGHGHLFPEKAGPSAIAGARPLRRDRIVADRHSRHGARSYRARHRRERPPPGGSPTCRGRAATATNIRAGMRSSRVGR